MTLPILVADMTGNIEVADAQRTSYDSTLNKTIPSNLQPYLLAGTGVPGLTAPKGSIYIDLSAAGANLRMYINTNGTTGWGAVTSA